MPVEDFPEWGAVNKKIAAGYEKWKEKQALSSTDRNTCPHGHPCIFIKLENGMTQAVGGRVQEGPYKEQNCPLCIETDWIGIPFRDEPPPPPKATFVTNGP